MEVVLQVLVRICWEPGFRASIEKLLNRIIVSHLNGNLQATATVDSDKPAPDRVLSGNLGDVLSWKKYSFGRLKVGRKESPSPP